MPKHSVIVGVDEAGRGPLAGPVVAGACLLSPFLYQHPLIKDSKVLSPDEREEAYAFIKKNCIWGTGMSDARMVDTHGILAATEAAMRKAIAKVAKSITPTYLLVDGRDRFRFDYPHTSIIRGDASEACISAASIMAKVTRDRLMTNVHALYPHYGFDAHKGYGSPEHIAAIKAHGPCPVHRHSYIKKIWIRCFEFSDSDSREVRTRRPQKSTATKTVLS